MTARFSNQFQSYLTEPLNIDATVIKIPPEDVKGLPILNDTDWFPLNISDPRGFEEIVHVTKVNADGTLVVKRAQEGTEAKNFRVESRVDIRLTAQSIESFLGLYYGARTVPPSNAQTGAAYLDISQKPNALKVLGDNGWANAVSYSLAGLRQQLFVPTEATKGPFTVPGGFTSGFANVNGLSVYAGHGMTIDAANASFKLDNEVPAGTIIVFQGYLANDAVDVFTKAEINNRFAELSANDVKETDDRIYMTPNERTKITDIDNRLSNFNADNLTETAAHKVMTADEREKIAGLDGHYLSKSGGTVNGDVTINDATGISYATLPNPAGEGNPTIRLGYTKKSKNFADLAFVGSSFNIYLQKFGDIARFKDDGTTYFANSLVLQGKSWWQPDGNMGGTCWTGGNLADHIENRGKTYQNACVTNSRVVGWVELASSLYAWAHLPSGYFATSYYQTDTPTCHFGGRQPQLFIANRGWFALGEW